MQRVPITQRFIITTLTLCLAIGAAPLMASAGVDDVLLGITGSQTVIDFSTNNGELVTSSAMGGNFEALTGGGCFISASASELAGISVIFGLCLVGLLIGLRLIINDPAEKEALEEVK